MFSPWNTLRKQSPRVLLICAALAGLYLSSFTNYLLFHSLAEMFSIVIACGLFMIAWNARDNIDSPDFVHLGTAYLFIGFLDFLHTLSYKGMGIFLDYDYYANQLWISARYLEAGTLIGFTLLVESRFRRFTLVMGFYILLTGLIIYSIFFSSLFPVCYIQGQGLTSFKITSEYIISGMLITAMVLLCRKKKSFSPSIFRLLFASIAATICSEIAFTFYIDNYGFSNMIGHYFKILSFYLIYISLVKEGIRDPISLFSSRLEKSTRELQDANNTKDTLLAIIAHDLRNSFNATIGLTGLLLDSNDGKNLTPDGLGILHAINTSAHSTAQMLENLLIWARVNPGERKAAALEANIIETAQAAFEYCLPQAMFKNVEMIFSKSKTSVVCPTDTDMLQTVLRNLLNNAIKYTPRAGSVVLSIETEEDSAILSVQDSGIGIDAGHLNDLLNGSNTSSTRGTENETGTGLGMHACLDFLEKMGSTLFGESTPGNGCRFWFSLPLTE